MDNSVKYYTYTHSTPSGDVFYVGKGCGRRAYSSSTRPLSWKKIVYENNGISIKITSYFDSEDDAFKHEVFLIEEYKKYGSRLINLTSGGRGPADYTQTEELRAHKSLLMTGYKYDTVTCPKCGKSGGVTSMKRWHFENCSGKKEFRSRATINGKRVFLGTFGTKAEADMVSEAYRKKMEIV
jgi:hypothetical protein